MSTFLKLLLTAIVFVSIGLAGPAAIASDASEGIIVHGDWKITLLDSQGQPEKEVEFSNDLANPGRALLVKLLTNQWGMYAKPDGSPLWGILVEVTGAETSDECKSLYYDLLNTQPGQPVEAAVTYELGTFTLKRVMTLPASCVTGSTYSITEVLSNTVAGVVEIAGWSSFPFSSTILPAPVVVNPDQPVLLEVTFSFE